MAHHSAVDMWVLLLGFLAVLWGIALTISALWKWRPPGEHVHRPAPTTSERKTTDFRFRT